MWWEKKVSMTEELSAPGRTLKANAPSEVAERMKPLLHGPSGAPRRRPRSRGHFFMVFSDVDIPIKCVRVHIFEIHDGDFASVLCSRIQVGDHSSYMGHNQT